jgi:hypothetical protein
MTQEKVYSVERFHHWTLSVGKLLCYFHTIKMRGCICSFSRKVSRGNFWVIVVSSIYPIISRFILFIAELVCYYYLFIYLFIPYLNMKRRICSRKLSFCFLWSILNSCKCACFMPGAIYYILPHIFSGCFRILYSTLYLCHRHQS